MVNYSEYRRNYYIQELCLNSEHLDDELRRASPLIDNSNGNPNHSSMPEKVILFRILRDSSLSSPRYVWRHPHNVLLSSRTKTSRNFSISEMKVGKWPNLNSQNFQLTWNAVKCQNYDCIFMDSIHDKRNINTTWQNCLLKQTSRRVTGEYQDKFETNILPAASN